MRKIKYFLIPVILGIFMYSCEKEDSSVIDPIITYPIISSVLITPSTFDTISLKAVFVAAVQSEEQVTSVTARVTNPYGTVLADVTLKDDGFFPDTSSGDGRFSGEMNLTLVCKLVGTYNVEFSARNISGVNSNTFISNFAVTNNNNQRPSVNIVVSPDSLRRPSGIGSDSVIIGFLQMHPFDPDGVCDVNQAYFFSFRPDGSATNNGNSISMFDDGNVALHCDSIAYDGKFSLCIKIVNNPNTPGYTGPPQIGNYRFKYFAKDFGGLESDSLVKLINVYP